MQSALLAAAAVIIISAAPSEASSAVQSNAFLHKARPIQKKPQSQEPPAIRSIHNPIKTPSTATYTGVNILAFQDNDCLGPAIANVTTTFGACATVNGMGTVMVNKPKLTWKSTSEFTAGATIPMCAFMTGYGDSNCTKAAGNMFALNSECGACQGSTYAYGVQCEANSGGNAVNIATFCADDVCEACNGQTTVKQQNGCTWVPNLGYVILEDIKPCDPVAYTLYYSASYCDEDATQILPFEVPSGTCNSALLLTYV